MGGLDPVFTVIYGVGFLVLLAAELVGLARKAPGDTITEHWRYIDGHLHGVLQWGWRVLTAGLLGWAALHLAGPWS
jgi:hypothetical protein